MSFKEKFKKLKKQLDINTYYPNYVTKWVFQGGFIILLLMVSVVVLNFGFSKSWVAIDCEGVSDCKNPYIRCEEKIIKPVSCDYFLSHDCQGVNCDKEFIEPGEYFGEKPPDFVKNLHLYFLLLFGLVILINHLIWYKKGERG